MAELAKSRYIKKLRRLVIEKLGRRNNAAQISVEISSAFSAKLRKRYRLAGRWSPRVQAEHRKLLLDSKLQNFARFSPLLEVPYVVAVVNFKLRFKKKLNYLDRNRQKQTINCEIYYLDCRFTTMEAQQ